MPTRYLESQAHYEFGAQTKRTWSRGTNEYNNYEPNGLGRINGCVVRRLYFFRHVASAGLIRFLDTYLRNRVIVSVNITVILNVNVSI